jgi:hypothetical protein
MLFDRPRVLVHDFEIRSGWQMKPEGLCRDEECIPMAHSGGDLDLASVASAFGSPLVQDAEAGLWSLGPPVASHAIRSARAPDLVLPDVHGSPFQLQWLHGKKVLLLAWASW